MQATPATALPRLATTWPGGLGRWMRGALLALLTFAALVLVARRLSGALVLPLATGNLLMVGVLASSAAASIRLLERRRTTDGTLTRSQQLLDWWPSAALAALALALSIPGASVLGLAMLWVVVISEELVSQTRFSIVGVQPSGRSEAASQHGNTLKPEHQQGADEDPSDEAHVEQQLTRTRAADGGQCVQGFLLAAFAVGQRTAIAHVAFCPPLASVPRFTCRQTAGPPVRIKVAQLLPQGVRLECKLSEPADEEAEARIEFQAISDVAPASAERSM